MSAPDKIWPDRLMIRDTGLHDDMGGGGQRIYTTAGRGYERKEYTRSDLCTPTDERVARLSAAAQEAITRLEYSADTFQDQGCLTRAEACRVVATELQAALRDMGEG